MTQRQRRKARVPDRTATAALLALSRTALDSAAQGICVYDADYRVVLFNRRYVEMFNMSADVIRPGLTYRQVLEHSASCGNFAPEAIDGILAERYAMIAAGVPFSTQQVMPSGLILTLDVRPLPDGAWV